MGLPEGRAGPVNGEGIYYDGKGPSTKDVVTAANGQTNPVQQPYGTMDAPESQDRSERQLDPNSEVDPRHRSKRRPSGQQRICGKCQRHLTGQFVRALGDTFHLECFTCNVCTFLLQHKLPALS